MLSDSEAFVNILLALKKYRHKLSQFGLVPGGVDVQVEMYNMRIEDEKQYSGAFCPGTERAQMILVCLLLVGPLLLEIPRKKNNETQSIVG
jgi:hypothetical protein